MKFTPILVSSFISTTALLGSFGSSAHADSWPTYQHDLQHTGRSSAAFDPTKLTLSWSAPTGYATAQIVDQAVIATRNGFSPNTPTLVSSFALPNGSLNWSHSENLYFASQAAYGSGLVVFTGQSQISAAPILYVLDAGTGLLKYTVPVNNGFSPLAMVGGTAANPVAYLTDGSTLTAVKLGAASGSVLWSATGSYGGSSFPTSIGNSLILAGPGQYYAVNAATGVSNHFQIGGISGGGGTSVAADSVRQQFYVLEYYNDTTLTLSAYKYVNNSTIILLWQKTGPGITTESSVAIGVNGNVYAAGGDTLLELDPTTGAIIRSRSGLNFANQVTPLVDGNALFAFSDSETLIYSLSNLSLIKTLPGSRGSSNTAFDAGGALDDTHFLLDYGLGGRGFDVYAVIPESGTLLTGLALCFPIMLRRRRWSLGLRKE